MLNVIVRGRTLTLLFVLAFCALAAAVPLHVRNPGNPWSYALFALHPLLMLFIAWRVLLFRARLVHLLRHMVTGDFDVGLPGAAGRGDEVSAVGGLVNRLADLVRTYDELRTRRIRQLRMTLQLAVEHAAEPMMFYDVTKDALECNAAIQGVPGSRPRSVPLSELQRDENGKALADILAWVVKQEKSPWVGNMTIQFPGQEVAHQMNLRIVPFKDKDGSVPMAVVFGKMLEESHG
ncbi:MAG: hypothetical protein AB7T27_04800 [Kiritimatiellia bacterium]